jgi:hypothetical protein
MRGNRLTQKFLAFPDHGHLLFCPSHNERVVIRVLLRCDDGLPILNAPPHGVLFQPFCPAQRQCCTPRDCVPVLKQGLCRRQHILSDG